MSWADIASEIRAEVEGRRELDRRIGLVRRARRPKLVNIRCAEDGCGRTLARITDTSQGPMFATVIEELPWDRDDPPPWHGTDPVHFPVEHFTDDEELVEVYTKVVHVDRGRPEGMPNYGKVTSLTNRGGWTILDLLDDSPWHPPLWVRCRQHPTPYILDRDGLRLDAAKARRQGRVVSRIASPRVSTPLR